MDQNGRITPAKTVPPNDPAQRYVFDALGVGATRHDVVAALDAPTRRPSTPSAI